MLTTLLPSFPPFASAAPPFRARAVVDGCSWKYAAMAATDSFAPAVYFVAILVFGQYALLNLTLAIVLDGSSQLLLDDLARHRSRLRRLAFETVAQRGHIFPRIAVDEQVVGALGRRGPDPESMFAAADGHDRFHGHEGNRAALSVLGLERRRPLQVPPP